MTAGKAVGQQFGASKKAKLVVVCMAELATDELIAGFNMIIRDLRDSPERRKHSVVTMSIVGDIYDGRKSYDMLRTAIGDVMDLDVPVVVMAGNEGGDTTRRYIDTVPAVFARHDRRHPLIVVGSCDVSGRDSSFSQRGKTIYAVGEDITAFRNDPSSPSTGLQGTSMCKCPDYQFFLFPLASYPINMTLKPHSSTTGRGRDRKSPLTRESSFRHK
jgi:hypothetical protein